MAKTSEQILKDFALLLNTGLYRWQQDQIASGVPLSRANTKAFCRAYHIDPSNWSGWSLGQRAATDLENLKLLAACPYIGPKVYRVLGLMPEVEGDVDELMVLEGMASLSPDVRKALIKFLETGEKEELLLVLQALPA